MGVSHQVVLKGNWHRDGSGHRSPDQSWVLATIEDTEVTLYLRWRWEGPWEGYVIPCSLEDNPYRYLYVKWSPDLFKPGSVQRPLEPLCDFFGLGDVPQGGFGHDCYEQAQTALTTRAPWWRPSSKSAVLEP